MLSSVPLYKEGDEVLFWTTHKNRWELCVVDRYSEQWGVTIRSSNSSNRWHLVHPGSLVPIPEGASKDQIDAVSHILPALTTYY